MGKIFSVKTTKEEYWQEYLAILWSLRTHCHPCLHWQKNLLKVRSEGATECVGCVCNVLLTAREVLTINSFAMDENMERKRTSSAPPRSEHFASADHCVDQKESGKCCAWYQIISCVVLIEERSRWRDAKRMKLKRFSNCWSFYRQTSNRTALREDPPVNYFLDNRRLQMLLHR